jgi:soluble cytochrome b562
MPKTLLSSLLMVLVMLTQPAYADTEKAAEPMDMSSMASHPDEHQHMAADEHLEHLMKQMKNAYRDAMRSENINDLKVAATTLTDLVEQASATPYGKTPEDTAAFKDGMRELKTDLEALKIAIDANDFAQAQQVLNTQIKATRNQSHQNLNVH